MPTSHLFTWPSIIPMAHEVRPETVLDVGPGHGKAGLLLREYVPTITRLDAVEAEPRYLDAFPWLEVIYDHVRVADARHIDYGGYDLVLMCDVIEHLTKDDGVELLRRIPGRVIICTPAVFFQNDCHIDYPTEEHRSVWSAHELAALRTLEVWDRDAQAKDMVLVRLGPL